MNTLYFRAADGTEFGFDKVEPECASLTDYLQREREIMLDHIVHGSGGLIMGGVSGLGKTVLAQSIAKQYNGCFTEILDIENSRALGYYKDKVKDNDFMVIDEGVGLIFKLTKPGDRNAKLNFIELLSLKKRILLGGGVSYVGKLQTDKIAECIGIEAQREVFQVSRMNEKQIVELLVQQDKRVEEGVNEKILADLELQAKSIIEPFRVPLHIKQLFTVLSNGFLLEFDAGHYMLNPRYNNWILNHRGKEYADLQISRFKFGN